MPQYVWTYRPITQVLRNWYAYRVIARSGLIDREWYLDQNPKVRWARLSPSLHYLLFGAAELRNPNRWFDTEWYLAQNPDVHRAGINPLLHYIQHGSREGRKPHPDFDTRWYQQAYAYALIGRINPLAHWLKYGEREGLSPNSRSSSSERTLRAADLKSVDHETVVELALPTTTVDVVIPIYRNLKALRRCLTSILASPDRVSFRILAIDDCSPEPEISRYLQELADAGKIILLQNEKNIGFTASANRGMRESSGDILLLNSDTEVPAGFIDRVMAHAYKEPNVATVTPFSNNATICSWPVIGGSSELPSGFTLAEIDTVFARVNAGRQFELPTGVGCCMLIRRAALEQVGFFNEELFIRGYGEECDFCQRALKCGWRNVLAADVFVYHEGEQSFGKDSQLLKKRADELLKQLHPNYLADVARFVANDPPYKARLAVLAALLRESSKPVVLQIVHALGGGVQKFLDELTATDCSHHIILKPDAYGIDHLATIFIKLGSTATTATIDLAEAKEAADVLLTFGITHIDIQHTFGFGHWLRELIAALQLPFNFIVHDYHAICPRIHLIHPTTGSYCGEPDHAGCRTCLELTKDLEHDIVLWREQHAWLFREAFEVICPSYDVAKRLLRYHPGREIRVVYHEDQEEIRRSIKVKQPADRQAFRVLVLGVMALHKGSELLIRLARTAENLYPQVSFIVVGYFEKNRPVRLPANIRVLGRYEDKDLQRKIESVDPHVILFPARWPETYSYTLTAALRSGRAIVAPDIGAFGERLVGLGHIRLYSLGAGPREIFGLLFEAGKAEDPSLALAGQN